MSAGLARGSAPRSRFSEPSNEIAGPRNNTPASQKQKPVASCDHPRDRWVNMHPAERVNLDRARCIRFRDDPSLLGIASLAPATNATANLDVSARRQRQLYRPYMRTDPVNTVRTSELSANARQGQHRLLLTYFTLTPLSLGLNLIVLT
jgi:hypothetical protein